MATLSAASFSEVSVETPRFVRSRRLPRWFCVGIALAAAGVLAIGFSRSFYARSSAEPPLRPIVVAHGLLFTSWIVLFIVQTSLVATRQVRVHRRLGYLGVALATLMVVSGPPMAIGLARRGQPDNADPLVFLLVLLSDVLVFALFFGGAVYYRRRAEAHQRLMLLAMTSLLPPAISRWPWVVRHPAPGVMGMVLLFLLAPAVADVIERRRPHPISVWGGLALLVSLPLRFAVGQTVAWHTLARWLTS